MSEVWMEAESTHMPGMKLQEVSDSAHIVQFYETEAYLIEMVGGFIGSALLAGDGAIVVATEAHRKSLEQHLQDQGLNVAAARARDQYIGMDAAETLETITVNGEPESGRFTQTIGDIIVRAARGGRSVRVFGEMVALLALSGNHNGAIRLEQLWNDLQQTHRFALLCAYPMDRLGGEALGELLLHVCAEHSSVIPAESFTSLLTTDDRLRAIAVLQQKARWLEAEIAERKHTEERLRAALASEQAALRLRDEFLSIAAHELKTPLTTLSAHAQLLLRHTEREGHLDPQKAVQSLEIITRRASKLSQLINQLLDVTRLEDGKLILEREPTDLKLLVEEIVSDARAFNGHHTITLDLMAPTKVRVDPLRIEQVLTNLLDNAIKYSPDHRSIEVALSQPVSEVVELSVRDHGPGISPEKRGQIFERFYQAHRNGHRSGWGLGLYISRQIVELHGGQIRCQFPPDGGTRFVVRLPIDLDEPAVARKGS